jgi:hypothetical protein
MLKLLVMLGADLDNGPVSASHFAALRKQPDSLRFLIDHGAGVNIWTNAFTEKKIQLLSYCARFEEKDALSNAAHLLHTPLDLALANPSSNFG